MIAVVDPEPATTVLVGEGHAPVVQYFSVRLKHWLSP
jgi:hypothetical protein